jgi:Ca2+/Na+ antiporter
MLIFYNLLWKHNNIILYLIKLDVAGATFMAAGASSPELFISFLGLFVQNSTIGVGTLLGSELFNHMIICAGSVFYARGGVLPLDAKIFTRDCLAYFFSLILLLIVAKGDFFNAISHAFDPSTRNECLDVSDFGALSLFLYYVYYVLVMTYFEPICKFILPSSWNLPQPEIRQSEFVLDDKVYVTRSSLAARETFTRY